MKGKILLPSLKMCAQEHPYFRSLMPETLFCSCYHNTFEGEIVMDASKPDGTMRKLTDISRIKALGWEPKITLEKGLEETYKWFQEKYESGEYAER